MFTLPAVSLQPDVVVTVENTYMFRYGELIEHLKSQWFDLVLRSILIFQIPDVANLVAH
jgi:hypothetical protein